MIGSDEEYCLTLRQKSVNVLIRLRGTFVTPEEVLTVKKDITYEQAREIASEANTMLLEVQRFLFRHV